MESNDFEEDFKFEDDNMSQSSGDSIFIGVEDQTEFADYAEKMKEIDVDMDLYSRLQGNRCVFLLCYLSSYADTICQVQDLG